ncbi:MAG: pyridoxamine 5'-phosphate oxidase family protein [Desulfobacterales bacterium]
MRRRDREIGTRQEMEAVIAAASVCRLAMSDDGRPYVVPLSFAYEGGVFYFHSAREGRKLQVLGKNPEVCIEVEDGVALKKGATPCAFGMRYRSVIAFGRAERVEGVEEKRRALERIAARYAPGSGPVDAAAAERTVVLRVRVEQMTGKRCD